MCDATRYLVADFGTVSIHSSTKKYDLLHEDRKICGRHSDHDLKTVPLSGCIFFVILVLQHFGQPRPPISLSNAAASSV